MIKNIRLNKNEKILILVFLILLNGHINYKFFIKQEIEKLNNTKIKETNLSSSIKNIQELKGINIMNLNKNIYDFDYLKNSMDKIIELINSMDYVNIYFNSLSMEEEIILEEDIICTKISLDIQGELGEINKFIKKLDGLEKSTVNQISIKSLGDQINLNVLMSIYHINCDFQSSKVSNIINSNPFISDLEEDSRKSININNKDINSINTDDKPVVNIKDKKELKENIDVQEREIILNSYKDSILDIEKDINMITSLEEGIEFGEKYLIINYLKNDNLLKSDIIINFKDKGIEVRENSLIYLKLMENSSMDIEVYLDNGKSFQIKPKEERNIWKSYMLTNSSKSYIKRLKINPLNKEGGVYVQIK